jgi:hypothetical protein
MDDNSAERMFYHVRSREVDTWRRRTFVTLIVCTLITASFFYFGPILRSILQHKDKILEAQLQGIQQIPDIQVKITSLSDQLKALSATAIENRLQTIETAMSVGNVKPEQIATVQDIRKEIDTLKTYMFSDPKALVDLKQLEKDYGDLNATLKNCPTKTEFESGMSTTKDLIYFTWTLVGVVFAILMWFGPKIFSSQTSVPTVPVAKQDAEESGGAK